MEATLQLERQKINKKTKAHTCPHTHTHRQTRMSDSSKINGESETCNVMVKRQVEIRDYLKWVIREGLSAEGLLC